MPIHVVLHRPEIPPNTGNVIRLCANSGAQLHLIRPLGFVLNDRRLRRAGLDYHEFATLQVHDDFSAFVKAIAPARIWAFTTRAKRAFHTPEYQADDALVFGRETAGLPTEILDELPAEQWLRLPMRAGNRSLNLSNSVAVGVYEVWRQLGYVGGV